MPGSEHERKKERRVLSSQQANSPDAAEALRICEARYRALFRDNPTMIFIADTAWNILSANPFGASRLGYTANELEGGSLLKLFREEDRAAVVEQLQKCLQDATQVHHWQFQKMTKDGDLLWVDEIAQVIYDLDGNLNILVICQDVTDRRRAEEALKISENRFRRLFETARDGVLILDAETACIIEVNPFLVEMLGYRREELLEKRLWDIGVWADVSVSKACFATLQQEEYIRYEDLPLVTKDGRSISVEFISSVYTVDQLKMVQCNIRDITDRKRAEEEIRSLNEDLTARAAALESANEELEAFNYIAAHDLRQPLNAIAMFCQYVKLTCGGALPDQCAEYIEAAHKSTVGMSRLIEALLNFSRVGRIEPRRDTVDLSAMAQEVGTLLRLMEPKRQVEFRVAEGITAVADPNLMRMVLDNLLGNAWKYTSTRAIAVVELGVTDIGGVATYFVRDNGIGFDMSDAGMLFTAFKRLPGAAERKGFGIGLATVERIVRCHGGKIWAEGTPEKGACFYFTLEADQA